MPWYIWIVLLLIVAVVAVFFAAVIKDYLRKRRARLVAYLRVQEQTAKDLTQHELEALRRRIAEMQKTL